MAVQNQGIDWSVIAAEDLDNTTAGTGHIYKAIAFNDRKLAANGSEASGIIQQVGKSGEHVGVTVSGISKYTAGGAVTAGALLTGAASGYLTAATSGDVVCGRNGTDAVTSGSVGTGIFQFAGAEAVI